MRGSWLHFDCASGAAGDMILGALLDVGVPEAVVREAIQKAGIDDAVLSLERLVRGGVAATKVRVRGEDGDHGHHDHAHDHDHHDHAHDHHAHDPHDDHAPHHHVAWRDLRARVHGLARDIFETLAIAEARVHGKPVDEVTFHEVGAVDSIVDIVGTAAALEWLAPSGISASVIATGSGTVEGAHGVMPVPPPAVVAIAQAKQMPLVGGGVARELLTPTGAAILGTVVQRYGELPPLTVIALGHGAGNAELRDRANVVRVILGTPATAAQALVELAANLDDMSPELCEHTADRLFAAGALDVWWTPVVMKKSRPAFVLGVLAPRAHHDALVAVILAETTTLGVRWHAVDRHAVERRRETVETPWGPVQVKVGSWQGRVVNAAPEYEDARRVAAAHGVPLKDVYQATMAAFTRR